MATNTITVTSPKPTALSWRAMDWVERTVSVLVVGGLAASFVVFGQVLVIASRLVL